jgi:two-component system, OmpR family, phosphate regulon sensor histidine kinase PhoR
LFVLAGAVALHFWWLRRYLRTQDEFRDEIRRLQTEHQRTTVQTQTEREALFDSMVEGLLLLDENGRIQLANRAFSHLLGVTSDVRNKTIIEALRLHELSGLVENVARGKQVLGHELRLTGAVDRFLEVNAASIADGRGDSRGAILVFHDVTRLKQLERTRQEFVANVSHELRTPLSLIKGYVETLLDGAKDNRDVATKFLQTIQRNSERLQLLIEDLLTISELESGRIKMNLQSVSLHSLVDRVFEDFKSRAATKKVTLANEAPQVQVRGDADRLQQVLGNLVDNAIKYGRAAGRVAVTGQKINGATVEVRVVDDGPGIPAESLERVFERFYRVDKARSREQGGTGLGLSIVKHIVQSHGGRIWAKSDSGKGTAICFTLPVETS